MAENLDVVVRLKDEFSSGADKINEKFKSFANGAAIAGAAVGALAIKLGKDAVQAFGESQRVTAQLEAVLQSTGQKAGITKDEITGLADALQKQTAYGDETIISGQNMLLTFTNIGKDVFPDATKAMLDMAVAMNGGVTPSGDELKTTAIQLGKALNDPIAGVSALKKVGVSLTDAQKQEIEALLGTTDAMKEMQSAAQDAEMAIPKLEKNLQVATMKLKEMEAGGKASGSSLLSAKNKVKDLSDELNDAKISMSSYEQAQKNNNSGMSQAEKLMKAQQIILKELGTEFGGSAAKQLETFDGKMLNLKERFGNVQEQMGAALIPILETFAGVLEKVTVFLENNKGVVEAIIPALVAFAGALMSIKIAMTAINAIQSAASGIGSVAKILTSVPLPVLAIVAALAALAAIVYLVVKNWDWIKEKAIEIWTSIKDFFTGIWDSVKGVFQGAIDFLSGLWNTFLEFFYTMGYNKIEGALLGIMAIIDTIFGTNIAQTFEKFLDFIHGIWDSIIQVFRDVINFLVGIFVVAWEALPDPIKNVILAIKDSIVMQFTMIKNFFVSLWEGIKSIFTGAFDFVKNAWDIFIDAVFSQGYNRIEGILLGIVEVFDYIFGTNIGDILWKFIEFMHGIWDSITATVSSIWEGIKNKISEGIAWLASFFGSAIDTVTNPFKAIFSGMFEFVKSIFAPIGSFIDGIIGGITRGIDKVKNAISFVKGKGSQVTGFAKGGIVPDYFANGGYAKGTDTVPAMLTPGELILNKAQQSNLAGNMGGGGVTININGNFVGNKEEAMRLGNIISKQLGLSTAMV